MTPSESAAVMEWLLQAWPQAEKFWPAEHQDLLQDDLKSLSISPEQCIARLRQLARTRGTTLPDLRKDVWAALQTLDRSQAAQATAHAQTGKAWSLVEHLRNTWGGDWAIASDEAVVWQYAKLRTMNPATRRADEVNAAKSLEFETRALGWDRDRVRGVLRKARCEFGLAAVEDDWSKVDKRYAEFLSRGGAQ